MEKKTVNRKFPKKRKKRDKKCIRLETPPPPPPQPMNRYRKLKTQPITKFTAHLVHSLNLSDQDVMIASGKSVHAGSKLGIWRPVSQSCVSCEIFVKNAFFFFFFFLIPSNIVKFENLRFFP